MSKDIKVTDGVILESLNSKIDCDGGNYPGSGLEAIVKKNGGGGGLEIGDIGFTQIAIDETKGKRRVLNGQLIIQEQYVQFTNIIKNSVALNSSLACTEEEWQTAVTMSTNGVCEKFVIDDNAGTIRLPKYPQYLDLTNNASVKTQTVSIKGNGKVLGLTNGNSTYGLGLRPQDWNGAKGSTISGVTAGDAISTTSAPNNNSITGYVGISTDASKSGITGSVTIPAVTSEQIKGTYFIQVATGAETEDNIINEIELNNPFSLLDYKWSDYELNNISWLHSYGQYNSKAVYPAVYELLLKIYNGIETKAGVSVKLNTEGYTNYDFVLNTAEETFRLPTAVKQTFFNGINGTFPVYGNGKAVTWTNGTSEGTFSTSNNNTICHSALTNLNVGATASHSVWNPDLSAIGVTTNPTKSGLIAQVSQSAVSGLYLYFYVGETVQNANLINAGRIEEKVAHIGAELPHKLNTSQITNCLLEVPQRIKYTVGNGVVTILAGSIIIVPYGTEDLTTQHPVGSVFLHDKFKVVDRQFADGKFFVWVELQGNLTASGTSTQTIESSIVANITGGGLTAISTSLTTSSSSQATGTTNTNYRTDLNVVQFIRSGALNSNVGSFPLLITNSDGVNIFASVSQVFNGVGYIGSTVWVDKGVKGLVPNGKNEDGSLNTKEYTTGKVLLLNVSNYTTKGMVFCVDMVGAIRYQAGPRVQNINPNKTYSIWYNPDENYIYESSATTEFIKREMFICGNFDRTQGDTNAIISNFQPKQPFRAVDYNDKQEIISWGMLDWSAAISANAAYTSSNKFVAPSDGYLIYGYWGTAAGALYVNDIVIGGMFGSGTGYGITYPLVLPLQKGDTFYQQYANNTSFPSTNNRFIPLKGAN